MKWLRFGIFAGSIWIGFHPVNDARSQEEPDEASPSSVPIKNSPKKRKAENRKALEKEAEGTRATNRFEKDPVIKSQYKTDGSPLEVDPD